MNIEVNFNEEQLVKKLIRQFNSGNLISPDQKITIVYNADSNDIVYIAEEVAKL